MWPLLEFLPMFNISNGGIDRTLFREHLINCLWTGRMSACDKLRLYRVHVFGHFFLNCVKLGLTLVLTACGLVKPYGDRKLWLTLLQIIACCLTASSHYLNHCCLIVKQTHGMNFSEILIKLPFIQGYTFANVVCKMSVCLGLEFLTHKQLKTHGCVISIVAIDALVLKHQAISIHIVDKIIIVLD